jgi:hypothetical protein
MRYFSSPGSPPAAMDSRRDTPQCRHCGVGCPIRRSRDHRALAPPPSFSQRATSFIASRCQGIHQMPLSCSPTPSPKAAPAAVAGGRCQRSDVRGQTASGRPGPHTAASSIPRLTAAWSRCVSIAPTGNNAPPAYLHTHARARPINRTRARRPRRLILSCPLHGHDSLHDVKTATAHTTLSRGGMRRSLASVRAAPRGRLCPLARNPRLVGLGRLERPTSRLSGVRSSQLSYRPGFRGRRSELRDQTPTHGGI